MLTLLLAATLALPERSAADYALLQGRVIIVSRSPHAVAIGVDTNNDGFADDLFWFYSTSAPSLRTYSEKTSIEFRGDELVIISADTTDFHNFSVGPAHVAQRGLSGTSAGAAYAGYGLTHIVGPQVNKISMPWPKSGRVHATDECSEGCIYNMEEPGVSGGGGGACDSGGGGATSCSITRSGDGCSVACATGYYACCMRYTGILGPPSCTCVHY